MQTAELHKLTEHVYYMEFAEQTDRPNLGYVCGRRQALQIDAGNSAAHAHLFARSLQEQGLMPPNYVVITHWHWDHTFGMCGVKAQTIVTDKTDAHLRRMRRWEWSDSAMRHRLENGEEIAFCDKYIRLEYPRLTEVRVKMADTVIRAQKSIDLGGVTCKLIPVDTPHSRDAMLVYIPEEGVLFGGDADSEDFYDNDGKYDAQKLAAYIKQLELLDFTWYVTGHWHPCTKQEEIAFLREKLQELQNV